MSTRKRHLENAFSLEQTRNKIASTIPFDEANFLKCYKGILPEIGKINKGKSWNKVYMSNNSGDINSPMTRNRFRIVKKMIMNIWRGTDCKLLDAGFGQGYLEDYLKDNKYIHIHGIDISSLSVKKAKNKYTGTYSVGNIIKIPYSNDTFDVVAALEILEHVPASKSFKVWEEINRVVKKEGYIIISVPLNENLYDMMMFNKINPSNHCRIYTQNIIIKELEISGFKIIKLSNLYAFKNYYWLKSSIYKIIKLLSLNYFLINPNIVIILAQKK